MHLDDYYPEKINKKIAFSLYFSIMSLYAMKITVRKFKMVQGKKTLKFNLKGGELFPRDLEIIYS